MILCLLRPRPRAPHPISRLDATFLANALTCHRSATATTTIPNIFGMAAVTMTQVIKAYRDKRLANAVMQGVAGRLKDDEIEALAAYFEQTKRP